MLVVRPFDEKLCLFRRLCSPEVNFSHLSITMYLDILLNFITILPEMMRPIAFFQRLQRYSQYTLLLTLVRKTMIVSSNTTGLVWPRSGRIMRVGLKVIWRGGLANDGKKCTLKVVACVLPFYYGHRIMIYHRRS